MTYRKVWHDNNWVTACSDCGSLVADEELHDKWHAEVAKRMKQAYSAWAFTQPIG